MTDTYNMTERQKHKREFNSTRNECNKFLDISRERTSLIPETEHISFRATDSRLSTHVPFAAAEGKSKLPYKVHIILQHGHVWNRQG
jgi:hypothetical protein